MNEITLSTNPAVLEISHLEQFFGVWAMHPETFESVARQISTLDLAAHVAAAKGRRVDQECSYDVTDDGVAVIQISGTLTKYGSSLTGGGTVAMRKAVRAAARDGAVQSIVLQIDSPGGTVSGTSDLAQEVAAAAATKPVVAYIEDMGASGAYWIASQAAKVYVNETGLAGSIGVFTVVNDYSAMAMTQGVKVHVVKAGEHKGAGTPGTVVTDAQLAELQRVINDLNAQFTQAVALGRRMDAAAVAALADGRIHVGREAVKLGLADAVKTFDEVLSESARMMPEKKRMMRAEAEEVPEAAAAATDQSTQEEGPAMAETQAAANYAELKGALVGADAAFICSQLETGATLAQATAAWMAEQNTRLQAATEEAEKAKAAVKAKPGVAPLGGKAKEAGAEAAADPIAEFNEAVEGKVKQGKGKAQAIAAVVRENPELHQAYLDAVNGK